MRERERVLIGLEIWAMVLEMNIYILSEYFFPNVTLFLIILLFYLLEQ